jgi:hypothetical protein
VQPQPEPGEPEMGDEVNRADDRRSGRTPVSDTIALLSFAPRKVYRNRGGSQGFLGWDLKPAASMAKHRAGHGRKS